MKQRTATYPTQITQSATEYGFKTANLQFLQQVIGEFSDSGITVPAFVGIKNSDIIAHLDAHAPQWKILWAEFCKLQGDNNKVIIPDAQTKLEALQQLIQDCFKEHKFTPGLPDGQLFMVRSTSNEDRVDVANPGGNESVPSKTDNISESCGTVIASYVSVKSLSQRLKSGEKITENFPLSACLVQTMVGEHLASPGQKPPVSGVIYTDNGHIRVQAAPGHGELVVNSKGNFDSYYVSPEGLVYSEIREKPVRVVPCYDQASNKMRLNMEDNSSQLSRNSSFDEEVALRVARLANFIERTYGMRMDIEFVYDPASMQINIVQARPIPLGDRRGLRPSALSNDFIAKEKPTQLKGAVITPDLQTATVINHPDEILVCNTISEALREYLAKPNRIKAVIIAQEAPDASHEAGMFTSKAIPVLQVDNLETAEKWVKELAAGKVMVCDPQHMACYQLAAEQFSEDLIKEGLYRSTLSPHVTPIQRQFATPDQKPTTASTPTSLGQLIEEAKTKPEAAAQLFKYIYDNVLQGGGKREGKYNTKTLEADLDKLALLEFGPRKNQERKEVLTNVLKLVVNARHKISPALFQQIMLNGAELHILLSRAETLAVPDEAVTQHYLNSFQKLQGSIISQTKKNVLSTSLVHEVAVDKRDKSFDTLASTIPEATRGVFREAVKLEKYMLSEADQQKWRQFCQQSCQNRVKATILNNLVTGLIQNGLHEYWLNTIFANKYTADPDRVLTTLWQEYDKSVAESKNIFAGRNLLNQMEHQISEWADPKNFARLYSQLKENCSKLEELLQYNPDNQLRKTLALKELYRQVDIIDKSIKALQTSSLYNDKEAQVQNFKTLVTYFWELVKKQPKVQGVASRVQVVDLFLAKDNKGAEQLLISSGFSALQSSLFDAYNIEFERGMSHCQHLADAHTLVHQTAISALATGGEELYEKAPARVHSLIKLLSSSECLEGWNRDSDDPNHMHLINAEIKYPKLNLLFNNPLSQHSAIVEMSYDKSTDNIILDYLFTGEGITSGEQNRWVELEKYSYVLLSGFTDAKIVSHDAADNMFNLKLEIGPGCEKTAELAKTLLTVLDSTFDSNREMRHNFSYDQVFYKQLQSLGIPSIELFTSADGKFNFKDFTKFIHENKKEQCASRYGINKDHLLSGNALYCYHKRYIDPQQLAQCSVEEAKMFTSDAVNAYKAGATFKDLSVMYDDVPKGRNKLLTLTSSSTGEAYRAGINFAELSQAYNEGGADKVNALTTWDAIAIYKNGVNFDDLSEAYQKGGKAKVETLISYDAVNAYKAGTTFKDLSVMYDDVPKGRNKLLTLTSHSANEAYTAGIKFVELSQAYNEGGADKVNALTTRYAIAAYKNGVKFDDLSEAYQQGGKAKVETLTLSRALEAYKAKVTFAELSVIYDDEPKEKIKLMSLTSSGARATVKCCV